MRPDFSLSTMIRASRKKALLFLVFALLLCACGERNEYASWYSSSSGDASGNASEIENTTLLEPAFTMGDSLFYLGDVTVQDLLNAGAVAYENDNEDVTASGDASQTITLYYGDEKFTVITESGSASDITDYTVTAVYFSGSSFMGPGGVAVGDPVSDLGEPFSSVAGEDVSDDYEGITAYYYVSMFDDEVLCAFVDDESGNILSMRVSEATNYVTEIDDILPVTLKYFCELYDVDDSPAIYEIDGSENVESETETTFTTATLYVLDEIFDLDNYDLGTDSLLDGTPNTLLVIEYEQEISYSADERAEASIEEGISLNGSYHAYGCFFIIDPIFTKNGIESDVSDTLFHSTGMTYLDRDTMLEHVFYASERGYNIDAYSAQVYEF